ncbi:MAG: FAD-dependent oxidoreductase [Aeromicrobium erythreum]
MRPVRDLLDRTLGRVTMYRLVLVVLALLVAVYSVFTATGVITGLSTGDNLLALAVLVVASYASNRLLGLLWRVRPHADSAHITALILFFLFVPLIDSSVENLAWLAATAAFANASKYVLAWRGRHVLNPAAAGAFIAFAVQNLVGRELSVSPIWQTAATEPLLPFVAVGALLVLWRTRRVGLGLAFVVPALGLVVWGLADGGQPVGDAVRTALTSYPILFIAGFMLTEPLTLPPRRAQQLAVAVVTAVAFAYPTAVTVVGAQPFTAGWFEVTPEVAILVGNLLAFALGRRRGIRLDYRGKRHLGGDTWELAFVPSRPVPFRAGQYLELHVPHGRSDLRGVRRVFSISSPPGADELTVAIRVPERSSSLKRELVGLEPGTRVHATGVGGDFLLPADQPVLLVAGGIGVTPFLSQLRDREHDAVVVYGVQDASQVAYRDELAATGVPVVLVAPDEPADLPGHWSHVRSSVVTGDVVAAAVPDADRRRAYVSGPPVMVSAVRSSVRRRVRGVRTDAFTGY